MYLLITTPLHIFQVDVANSGITIVRSGDGYYYGISCYQDQIVLTHSGGYLQFYASTGTPIRTIKTLLQPHQVEWIDDKVVVANTGKNRLSIFESSGTYLKDVFLNDIRWDDKESGRKGNHFNSVHKVGNELYVVAHNYERNSEVYLLSWPEFNILEVIVCQANWAHNFWSCEWGSLICDSKNGSLYNVTDAKTIWSTDKNGSITRGLAATNKHIFVGSSENCTRAERPWTSGCIWIIDRETLRTVKRISLPGSGEIRDIRVIGAPDECHNGQIITPQHVKAISKTSPVINLAYQLRKKYPNLRRDFPPISVPVRARQLLGRLDLI